MIDTRTGEITGPSKALATAEKSSDPLTINYAIHPVANLFPLIEGADFDSFVEDIRKNGQEDPVMLDSTGQLLDGRNRARACAVLGIDVKEARYHGDNPTQYVISHNLHRRQMTNRQRAMVGGRLANLPHGGATYSPKSEGSVDLSLLGPTRAQVGELLHVPETSIQRAKAIIRKGTPALIALADDGKVSLTAAGDVAQSDPQIQDAWVEQVREGKKPPRPLTKPDPLAKTKAKPGRPSQRNILKAASVRKITETLSGYQVAFPKGMADVLDPSLTNEEAARLADDLSKSIAALHRLKRLLTKERIA